MQTSNQELEKKDAKSVQSIAAPVRWWRSWWRSLSPTRQDRYAALAPLASVLMFMAAIIASFWYLRTEEVDREHEALRRDVEYAQQRVRLRLLERQEQLMRMARDIGTRDVRKADFDGRSEALISQFPELQSITWINDKRQILHSQSAPTVNTDQLRVVGETLHQGETLKAYEQAREILQPIYVQEKVQPNELPPLLQLHVPISNNSRYQGELLAEFSVDSLLRYGTPTEVLARYAITLLDGDRHVLAGTPLSPRKTPTELLHWRALANEYEVPVSPVGNSLILRAQAYQTSLGVVGSGLFWLVGTLSTMTAWLLLATWRHTRRRQRAQEALVAETNFRRAMENSVLTGMRALDLQGRITYVNAAFCQMTGWTEKDLV
ncbi:MAG: PAS domain-containing protein, partial [Comamonas sp.]